MQKLYSVLNNLFIYFSVQCDDQMCNDQNDESQFNVTRLETNALDFQANTANEFVQFLYEIEPLTIISLMFKWLKSIASIWNHEMPAIILEKFLKIYECYLFVLCLIFILNAINKEFL